MSTPLPLPSRARPQFLRFRSAPHSLSSYSYSSLSPARLSIHHFLLIRGLMTRENSTARLKFDRSLISRSFFNYRSSFFFLPRRGRGKIGGRKRSARSVRDGTKLREWCPMSSFFFSFSFLSFFLLWKETKVCVQFGSIVSARNEEDFFSQIIYILCIVRKIYSIFANKIDIDWVLKF